MSELQALVDKKTCSRAQVPLEELLDDLAGLNLTEADEAAASGLDATDPEAAGDEDGSQADMEH